jgi:carbon storage regulator
VFVVRRRVGEKITIAGEVELEVLEISRTRIKLGITAPREVPVVRTETIAVAAENRAASAWLSDHHGTHATHLMDLLKNLRAAQVPEPVADE